MECVIASGVFWLCGPEGGAVVCATEAEERLDKFPISGGAQSLKCPSLGVDRYLKFKV